MMVIQDITDFAACLWMPDDIVEVRCLQNGDSRRFWHCASELPGQTESLAGLNDAGWNIYAGVAPRPKPGASGDDSIEFCRALFCDFDGKHLNGSEDYIEYVKVKIKSVGLPIPTMIIFSGHGVHCYWRLAKPIEPARWKKANTRLSVVLGSDSTVCNFERLMRLPGLMNNKPPSAPCVIVEHDKARTYAPADFAALRQPGAQEQPIQPPTPKTKPVDDQAVRAAAYAATWERLPEGDGRNQALYVHVKALVNDMGIPIDIARQTVIEWNRENIPPLSDRELEQTISDALKYASKKPAGCKNNEAKPAILKAAAGEASEGVWQNALAAIAGRRVTIPLMISKISDLTHCTLPGEVVVVVGAPGASKSYWLLQEAANWFEQGHKIALLEAEKNVTYHLNRLAAQRSGYPGFVYPEWQKEHPEFVASIKAEHKPFLDAFGRSMFDNSQNVLTMSSVIEWVKAQAKGGCRLILIDPLTVVDRERVQTWEADKHFMGAAQTICAKNGCTLLFVLHCTKAGLEPSLSNVGGGATFTQLADCVLWLYSHDKEDGQDKTSYVETPCGIVEVTHNRSILILKSRYEGTGRRVVCTFEKLKLRSHGMGTAKPKG